jgi:hypothetical protein
MNHEQEQRHRHQRVVLHHRVGVLVQQIENIVVEHIRERLDAALVVSVITEPDAHRYQGERNRKAKQYQEDKQAQHEDGDFGVCHGRLSVGTLIMLSGQVSGCSA